MSFSKPAKSADHQDSKTLAADPASDINDVYSWMDGNNVVLGMTVFPFADANAKFSDSVKYVFHVSSMATFGTTEVNTDVICTFDTAQKASCWVGTDDYVTGDASAATGLSSASGKTKVFAGRVEDPFHFNLVGFKDAVGAALNLTPDMNGDTKTPAGCYTLKANELAPFPGLLKEVSSTNAPTKTVADDFVTAQGLAIVVTVDKSLVSSGGPILAVWGATTH